MPASFEMQTKGVVDGVAGLVSQDAHALDLRAAFDFQHLLSFELHQTGMRQIERNGEARYAVGRKPFRRQPDMGFETNAAIVQLAIEALNMRFKKRALDPDRQIA